MTLVECQYRTPLSNSAEGLAVCGLLQELTSVQDRSLCAVQPDACRACCHWFRPSPTHLNPAVASLLYGLSSRIAGQGGVPGCERRRAVNLIELAAANIPLDEDCVSVAAETQAQVNLDCADLDQIVPRPRQRCGPPVKNWAVGVTTAPRHEPTLDLCLASMAAAGWTPPRLFMDGDVRLSAAAAKLPRTERDPKIGAWPNYFLALGELVMRSPQADAFLLVQDDVVFFQHPSLRSFLESVLWPGSRPGLVSLFCSRAYTHQSAGWHELPEALVWGGQAIIYSRAAALALLADQEVVRHRLLPGATGLANIDGVIGQWAQRAGLPVFLPTPSLVQHIGHVSSLWPEVRAFGNRRAARFAGGPDRNSHGHESR